MHRQVGTLGRHGWLLGLFVALLLGEGVRAEEGPAREAPPSAEALEKRAGSHLAAGDLQAAEADFRQALALREAAGAIQGDALAATLTRLGTVLARRGSFEEAERLHRRALALCEAQLGAESNDAADIRTNLGALRRFEGRIAEALPWYEQALAIRRITCPPGDPRVARALSNLGVAWDELQEPARALPLHEEAVRILAAQERRDPRVYTRTLGNLAQALRGVGRLAEARASQEEVLAIRVALVPSHPEDVAKARSNLAGILLEQGEPHQALQEVDLAVQALEAQAEPGDPVLLDVLGMKARVLRSMARFVESEAVLRAVLGGVQRRLGSEHASVAAVLVHLGSVLGDQGRLAEARALLERAVRLHVAARGEDSLEVAQASHNLAALLDAEGLPESALPHYERALRIRETRLGREHATVGVTLQGVATSLSRLGRRVEALAHYERALKILESAMGVDHPLLARVLSNSGLLRHEMGDRSGALADFTRALEIGERSLESNHPDLAAVLLNLGWLLAREGRGEQADSLYSRALAIREAALGPDHPRTIHTLAARARLDLHEGRDALAMERLREALRRTVAGLRSRLGGLQGAERLAYVRTIRGLLDEVVALGGRLGVDVYADVLGMRGIVFRVEAAERAWLRGAGPDALARRDRLSHAQAVLAQRVHAVTSKRDSEEVRAAARKLYTAALDEERDARLAMAADSASIEAALRRQALEAASLGTLLAPAETLADILRTADGYVAWVTQAGGSPRRVDLGSVDAVDQACEAFLQRAREASSSTDEGWQAAGTRLAELLKPLLQPLREAVPAAQGRTLYVVPDGALAAVPLGALPGTVPGTILWDETTLVLLGQPHDLLPGAPVAALPTCAALLVGDVDYGRTAAAPPAIDVSSGGPPSGPSLRARPLASLPGTRLEIDRLALLWPDGVRQLRGAEATVEAVSRLAPGCRILHLATHGIVRDDLPSALRAAWRDSEEMEGSSARGATTYDPLVLCGLAFAGANLSDASRADDGILTGLEVSGLALEGTDLAVLSACVSGRGSVESGEGVMGLVRAFRTAGVRRVVASLWHVSDEATSVLMERFYEALLTPGGAVTPAQALRTAAVSLRTKPSATTRLYDAPRHWASFCAYGR